MLVYRLRITLHQTFNEPDHQPVTSQPSATSQPTTSQPTTRQAATSQPATSQPATSQPPAMPATIQPADHQQTTSQQQAGRPTTSHAQASQPTTSHPQASQPTTGQQPTKYQPAKQACKLSNYQAIKRKRSSVEKMLSKTTVPTFELTLLSCVELFARAGAVLVSPVTGAHVALRQGISCNQRKSCQTDVQTHTWINLFQSEDL